METKLEESFDNLLETESAFYEKNRTELLMKYPNRFLLNRGDKVHGDFPTQGHAITEGVREFGSTPFLVRLAGEEPLVLTAPALTLGILQCQ
ncbi:MAG: hypothetical protein F4Y65_04500 [Gammaproteobacteria bacterium]|nr:hypothetical protein [Gammaproteobacteria bacterium]